MSVCKNIECDAGFPDAGMPNAGAGYRMPGKSKSRSCARIRFLEISPTGLDKMGIIFHRVMEMPQNCQETFRVKPEFARK